MYFCKRCQQSIVLVEIGSVKAQGMPQGLPLIKPQQRQRNVTNCGASDKKQKKTEEEQN